MIHNTVHKSVEQPAKRMSKISIRFFNDREVRAVWDEAESKWWFSVLDIIGVLNDQDDYNKNRNYWKYLKTKLKREGSEVVSLTNQLRLIAPDGKKRLSSGRDCCQIIRVSILATARWCLADPLGTTSYKHHDAFCTTITSLG